MTDELWDITKYRLTLSINLSVCEYLMPQTLEGRERCFRVRNFTTFYPTLASVH